MNQWHRISVLFFLAITCMTMLPAKSKQKKKRIAILNKYGQDISVQLKWRKDAPPHTQQIQEKTIKKNANETCTAPLPGYNILDVTIYGTQGIADAMKKSIKRHGNSYFVVNKGSRYKNDSGLKRRRFILSGYPSQQAYLDQQKALIAQNATAIAAAKKSTKPPISSCTDGSIGTCYDKTPINSLFCAGNKRPDLNGMCDNKSLVICPDGYEVACDNGDAPVYTTPGTTTSSGTALPAAAVPAATPAVNPGTEVPAAAPAATTTPKPAVVAPKPAAPAPKPTPPQAEETVNNDE